MEHRGLNLAHSGLFCLNAKIEYWDVSWLIFFGTINGMFKQDATRKETGATKTTCGHMAPLINTISEKVVSASRVRQLSKGRPCNRRFLPLHALILLN